MNVKSLYTMYYSDFAALRLRKNKVNSKPNSPTPKGVEQKPETRRLVPRLSRDCHGLSGLAMTFFGGFRKIFRKNGFFI